LEEPSVSFWRNKTVLITGADGFAGSHLCEQLVELEANVRAFVKPGVLKNINHLINKVTIIRGDVLDYQSLLNALRHVDVVFHLAAITLIPETRAVITKTFEVNTLGTLNVLLASKETGVKKVVYASTCHVYGYQEKLPITEDHIPKPIDIYSASKLSAEYVCTSFVEMFKMDISISRAFNHYGPRQREEFLIPTIITNLLRGKRLNLGSPEPTRDYSYITDIIEGYMLLAEHGEACQVYQFCSGIERSVREIVEKIIRVGGFEPREIRWNPQVRKVDIPRSYGTYEKAKKELGWEPKVSFEEGISKTINWYRLRIT
jgi:nucleoside-diphosphate-sugar epimerase